MQFDVVSFLMGAAAGSFGLSIILMLFASRPRDDEP